MASFINYKSISNNLKDFMYLILAICSIYLLVLFCIVNIVIFSFIILHFLPHTPTVHLNSVAITSLNTNANNLTATFDLTFTFTSPLYIKQNISYSDLEVRVLWSGKDNITLASTSLSPFTQEFNSVKVIRAELTMADGLSNNSDVAIGIGAERDSGSVKIGVNLSGLLSLFSLRANVSETMEFKFDGVFVKFPAGSKNGSWTRVVPRPELLMNNFIMV